MFGTLTNTWLREVFAWSSEGSFKLVRTHLHTHPVPDFLATSNAPIVGQQLYPAPEIYKRRAEGTIGVGR